MNVTVRRRPFGEYAEIMANFAKSCHDRMWAKGCHKDGYDYIDLWKFKDFQTVSRLSRAMLPQHQKAFEWSRDDLHSFRLLRMTEGCVVPPHTDKSDIYKFHSLNMLLQPPELGGALKINSVHVHLAPGDSVGYCATEMEHEITQVVRGTLFMFSAQVVTYDEKYS